MALICDAVMEILRRPTAAAELALLAAPLSVAVIAGLLLGWAWRPRWAAALVAAENKGEDDTSPAKEESALDLSPQAAPESKKLTPESKKLSVTEEDLEHLCRLIEERDGGRPWMHMMDRALPNMGFQAWRRDPESAPTQYRSSTVFEDVTPELVRDFFWDDEFRIKNGWDDMLLDHQILEECPATGAMTVRWIRKFPFFCSDREYFISRRIWKMGGSYYCVTKGVPCPSIPRRNKPRRVDFYYSSWCVRPVESRRGDGQMTACEVLLFHQEDMGIPWELAKLGIRQGMWGCVKKVDPGIRAYQIDRNSGEPLSKCAALAQITTKVNTDYLVSLETSANESDLMEPQDKKQWGLAKFLLVGGAVALACTLDHGLVTKAVIFGVARRFGKLGKGL